MFRAGKTGLYCPVNEDEWMDGCCACLLGGRGCRDRHFDAGPPSRGLGLALLLHAGFPSHARRQLFHRCRHRQTSAACWLRTFCRTTHYHGGAHWRRQHVAPGRYLHGLSRLTGRTGGCSRNQRQQALARSEVEHVPQFAGKLIARIQTVQSPVPLDKSQNGYVVHLCVRDETGFRQG